MPRREEVRLEGFALTEEGGETDAILYTSSPEFGNILYTTRRSCSSNTPYCQHNGPREHVAKNVEEVSLGIALRELTTPSL